MTLPSQNFTNVFKNYFFSSFCPSEHYLMFEKQLYNTVDKLGSSLLKYFQWTSFTEKEVLYLKSYKFTEMFKVMVVGEGFRVTNRHGLILPPAFPPSTKKDRNKVKIAAYCHD